MLLNIYHTPEVGLDQDMHRAVLSLSAGATPQGLSSGPMALGLVLDRSASMKLPMLAAAKEAANRVVDLADESVVLMAVAFSDQPQVLEKPAPCTSAHKQAVKRALTELRATGGTAIGRALDCVVKQIGRYRKHRKRILLLTDGKNMEDRKRLEQVVAVCSDEGFEITAWGLGLDWDERELQFLAHSTGGSCDLILDPLQTARAFAQSFQQMLKTAACDVRAIIKCSPGVRLDSLRQTFPHLAPLHLAWDQDRCLVRLGSLAFEDSRAYMMETRLEPGLKGPGKLEIELAWAGPSGESLKVREELEIRRCAESVLPHPFVTHYLKQEELSQLADAGRLALVEGEVGKATQLLRRALDISRETGNDYLTKLIRGLLETPATATPVEVMGTRKTLALHSGKTVFHDTKRMPRAEEVGS